MRYNRGPLVSTTQLKEAEQDIVTCVNMLRNEGENTMLREKAKAVAAAADVAPFEAPWSWREAFQACHKLSIQARTRHGKSAAETTVALVVVPLLWFGW
ncbi:hypothetical protein PybrP1_004487 [[Pythium] brassicae (nom. inval.)]|nr:hypothetical protein PybrP1_004487 [[Pythium] brassicae (nom. inval.)]